MSKYPHIRRKAKLPPWGYKVCSYDRQLLEPIEEQMDILEDAKKFLRTCSFREVAAWMTKKSGRPISGPGLFLRAKREKWGRFASEAKDGEEESNGREKADERGTQAQKRASSSSSSEA